MTKNNDPLHGVTLKKILKLKTKQLNKLRFIFCSIKPILIVTEPLEVVILITGRFLVAGVSLSNELCKNINKHTNANFFV